MKITKVYTRTGDKGETSLVGGVRIKKSDIRLEAYGTVDELSAHLGMLVAMMKDGEERDLIIRVQNNLFTYCCISGPICATSARAAIRRSARLHTVLQIWAWAAVGVPPGRMKPCRSGNRCISWSMRSSSNSISPSARWAEG